MQAAVGLSTMLGRSSFARLMLCTPYQGVHHRVAVNDFLEKTCCGKSGTVSRLAERDVSESAF